MIALELKAMPSNENDFPSICLNIGTKANNWMDWYNVYMNEPKLWMRFFASMQEARQRRCCMNLGKTREAHKN